MNGKLTDERNIGPKTAIWLHDVGVHSREEIVRLGIVEVFLRLEANRPRQISSNALWALWGAINDRDFREISPEEKAELLAEVNARQTLAP